MLTQTESAKQTGNLIVEDHQRHTVPVRAVYIPLYHYIMIRWESKGRRLFIVSLSV